MEVVQLVKNLPEIYGNRRIITVVTGAHIMPYLSHINPIYSLQPELYKIHIDRPISIDAFTWRN
jgi:hypothetical protein